jgi:PilZ domain
MNRRLHDRFFLEAALRFLWEDPSGFTHEAQGLVRDISMGGAFIVASAPPPVGTTVRIAVFLRSVWPRSALVIEAKGQVVRVEAGVPRKALAGFAATVETLVLQGESGEIIE